MNMRHVSVVLLSVACVEIDRPAENGPQDMVLMATPTYEYVVDRPIEPLQLEMIASMLPSVEVGLIVNDPVEHEIYSEQLQSDYGVSEADLDNLVPLEVEHTDVWVRDMGGIFVHASLDHVGESLAVLDFEFDGWGYGAFSLPEQVEFYEIDNLAAGRIADALDLPVIYSPLIMEGGAFQSNGEGVIAYSVQTATQRNPGWSVPQIEREMKRVTGAEKLLALPAFHLFDGHAVLDGPLELDGQFYHHPITVRHADEVMQFVDANTILVSQLDQTDVVNDLEQQAKERLDQIWDFLAASTDVNGDPFELIALPDPGFIPEAMVAGDALWDYLATLDGLQNFDPAGGNVVLPASYMNFVLTNDLVLVPTFYKEGRNPRLLDTDAEAMAILAEQFAPRAVVQVDSDNVVIGGGGMHCITQEVRSL